MVNLDLQADTIDHAKKAVVERISKEMDLNILKIVLYGSCARGDYSVDSDMDIALLVNCDRISAKRYTPVLAEIAADLAMKYFVVVNFVCLPMDEFVEKKTWYPYFKNIDKEGEILYG